MKTASRVLQVLLVVTTAITLVVVCLVASAGRAGLASEIADAALASPSARAEIATTISDDLKDAAPALAAIPGIEALMHEAVESPALETQVQRLVEHEIRARLGEDVGPLLLQPHEILQSDNPLVTAGIRALPPVELQPVPAANTSLPDIATGALVGSLAVAVGSYLTLRRTAGRARAAALVGLGGLAAAVALFALPLSAPILGAVRAVAVAAIITPTWVAVIAGASALITMRAIFAETGLLPYRVSRGFSHSEQGSFDLDFVLMD